MNIHYLDNSATTMLCEDAKQAIASAMDNNFGNPSSLHALGVMAEQAISEARSKIIYAMGVKAKPEQIIFTSGGTEAANLALIGFATAKPRNKGKKIIIGESEHDCVLRAAEYLEKLGFKVVRIPSPNGVWDIKAYEKACGKTIPYVIDPRRPGDIAVCYADPAKATEILGWTAEYDLARMCEDSYRWQSMNPKGLPNS